MPYLMRREIDRLKKEVIDLATLVEESLQMAVDAVLQRNEATAKTVWEIDRRIDQKEIDVEEECLKILALHQPVAADLRLIITILKINHDLERVGDLSGHLSEHAVALIKYPTVECPFDIELMTNTAAKMLRQSLDALFENNEELAREVIAQDDTVDTIHREMFDLVKDRCVEHPSKIEALFHYHSASKNIERIADHATNIAQDVIYQVKGKIVRHED